jgi:hypothetical protein
MRNAIFIIALLIIIPVLTIPVPGQDVDRRIQYRPASPRVGQRVTFESIGFITQSVDWDFGDGTKVPGGNRTVRHRYQAAGTYTVSARDTPIAHIPVTTVITILEENRYIEASPTKVGIDETVTVTAYNFRGAFIQWDFDDGTQRLDGHTVTHRYRRTGNYTITAREDCDDCPGTFTAGVIVTGIDDRVELETAEILLDNGKQYKVVPRNSKNIQAVLRMKMNGTGTLSGYWLVDDQPFEFFTQKVIEGELKEIYTGRSPGLPTIDPGIHTITLELTKPADLQVSFPVLKYFVLPGEMTLETLAPPDRFVAKEDEIPTFSWKETRGAASYQVAFANSLFPFLSDAFALTWNDAGTGLNYTPGGAVWNTVKRNRWTYWQVRALDDEGKVAAQSDIREIKVVIAAAQITINKVTDLEGREIKIAGANRIHAKTGSILVQGSIRCMGDSEFIVLRVYVDNKLADQLLFRDVGKNRECYFETFVPNWKKTSRVVFNVLKTSSPAVIVGIKELILKK